MKEYEDNMGGARRRAWERRGRSDDYCVGDL
jgi:hypothetical protein